MAMIIDSLEVMEVVSCRDGEFPYEIRLTLRAIDPLFPNDNIAITAMATGHGFHARVVALNDMVYFAANITPGFWACMGEKEYHCRLIENSQEIKDAIHQFVTGSVK